MKSDPPPSVCTVQILRVVVKVQVAPPSQINASSISATDLAHKCIVRTAHDKIGSFCLRYKIVTVGYNSPDSTEPSLIALLPFRVSAAEARKYQPHVWVRSDSKQLLVPVLNANSNPQRQISKMLLGRKYPLLPLIC